MKLSETLKYLAKGINPETGEILESRSITNTPEVIRVLYEISDELSVLEATKKEKVKLTPEQKRSKNLSEGKPAQSHFPWGDDEKDGLAADFKVGVSIEGMALEHERSPLAIAIQLEKLELIDDERVAEFRDIT